MNNRRKLVIALGAGALTASFGSFAQQQGKSSRIGFLSLRVRPDSLDSDVFGAFRRGMRELGYIEGKDLNIEWRFAGGNVDQLSSLAAELVQLKVDIIAVGGTQAIQAVQKATATIPIVMTSVGDAVGAGFVASLARPRGNITGVSLLGTELSAKRLEMLKESLPKLTRVAIMWNPDNASVALKFREMEVAARVLGIQVHSFQARLSSDIEPGIEAVARARAGAIMDTGDALQLSYRAQIIELAMRHRIPVASEFSELADVGALCSYGPSLKDLARRAATYVDKILKGAKPGDLPVEQPTTFELAVNMKTAKAFGIKFPPSIMVRATKIIE